MGVRGGRHSALMSITGRRFRRRLDRVAVVVHLHEVVPPGRRPSCRREGVRSARCAAVWAMRRPVQDGQTHRPLQEKAKRKSWPQPVQRALAHPNQRMSQRRYSRNSPARCVGTGRYHPALDAEPGIRSPQVEVDHQGQVVARGLREARPHDPGVPHLDASPHERLVERAQGEPCRERAES